jgi:hypothetical protein
MKGIILKMRLPGPSLNGLAMTESGEFKRGAVYKEN